MLELLKIIHFLALGTGVGLGVASMVLGLRAAAAQGPAVPALRQAQAKLGRIALIAIVFLWISGLWMWQAYNEGTMETLFLAKIAFVLVLTALSIDLNLRGAKVAKGGTPVDPAYAKRSGMIMGSMSLMAVISAVLVFS